MKTEKLNGNATPAWADTSGYDEYGKFADLCFEGVIQCFRWIAPGCFFMGSFDDEPERWDDEVLHEVSISRGFWMADTVCTQAMWMAVMGENPCVFQQREDNPVDNVSWEDIRFFLKRINATVSGLELRLPTEAEWEYACRAQTRTPFYFGDVLTTDTANYNGNRPYNNGHKGENREKTVPVKAFACNAWGLFEMHGNVWEWCQDWFGKYPKETVADPHGPVSGDARVLRGGSWHSGGRSLRSAHRYWNAPYSRFDRLGFRLVRD